MGSILQKSILPLAALFVMAPGVLSTPSTKSPADSPATIAEVENDGSEAASKSESFKVTGITVTVTETQVWIPLLGWVTVWTSVSRTYNCDEAGSGCPGTSSKAASSKSLN